VAQVSSLSSPPFSRPFSRLLGPPTRWSIQRQFKRNSRPSTAASNGDCDGRRSYWLVQSPRGASCAAAAAAVYGGLYCHAATTRCGSPWRQTAPVWPPFRRTAAGRVCLGHRRCGYWLNYSPIQSDACRRSRGSDCLRQLRFFLSVVLFSSRLPWKLALHRRLPSYLAVVRPLARGRQKLSISFVNRRLSVSKWWPEASFTFTASFPVLTGVAWNSTDFQYIVYMLSFIADFKSCIGL